MPAVRTMHDIRTMRSTTRRALPESEGAFYLQLHRLASEKGRLTRELELWLRKKDRIEQRVAELDEQMAALRRGMTGAEERTPGGLPAKPGQPVIIEY